MPPKPPLRLIIFKLQKIKEKALKEARGQNLTYKDRGTNYVKQERGRLNILNVERQKPPTQNFMPCRSTLPKRRLCQTDKN